MTKLTDMQLYIAKRIIKLKHDENNLDFKHDHTDPTNDITVSIQRMELIGRQDELHHVIGSLPQDERMIIRKYIDMNI